MEYSTADLAFLASECQVPGPIVARVMELFAEGLTVPFISRYRKEHTGNLDEEKVNLLKEKSDYLKELNERKTTVLATIEEQGKLTEELKAAILGTYSKTDLEDLYLPYRPRRRTKATVAREKGLEPLALLILDTRSPLTTEEMAPAFVDAEKGVETVADALEGAGHIIAELFSEHAELRQAVRRIMGREGQISVAVTPDYAEKRSKFEQYYAFSEGVGKIPSHRILAVFRGQEEEVLRAKIELDREKLQRAVSDLVIADAHPRSAFLDPVLEDALKRLILPAIELEIKNELKTRADEEAIMVFASNLEKLLLAAPAGSLRVLGVDPGYRTGCKLVVLDETGKLLDKAAIYPTKPRADIEGSRKLVQSWLEKHRIQAVAIGNGTASRETHAFFKSFLPADIICSLVSEAGASVYSASAVAREEFPEEDVTVRGAISIARRFQDPLSELVKIDPKAIGVGQYQHDVNQSHLAQKLDTVVESVVNRVGVEINSASYHLLRYVAGIGPTLAKNIVKFRDENGRFRSRTELMKVRMFGDKAFLLSAGFLRIRDGENPLDSTGIHPETYDIVERMARDTALAPAQLVQNEEAVKAIVLNRYISDQFGLPTLQDIVAELRKPGRDPRENFELFEYEEGVEEINDLEVGMELPGVISNVTHFGAFVDIGVHQDGLVHVSELSHQFITKPEDVVSVGDKVKVKVLSVDKELKRIQLSIKALLPVPERKPAPNNRRSEPPRPSSPERKQTPPQNRPPQSAQRPPAPKTPPPQPVTVKQSKEDALADLKRKWGSK
jgi:uncharacterized protein